LEILLVLLPLVVVVKKLLWIVLAFGTMPTAFAQTVKLKGIVSDAHNEEAIPYASVVVKPGMRGTTSDSLGNFELSVWPATDTLIITYVGYAPYKLPLTQVNTSEVLKVIMQRGVTEGVVVRTKINRGLLLWRKIVKNKDKHNRARQPAFGYEMHNKIELDINSINKDKLEDNKLLKPFAFVLNNIDTSENGVPILPVFLTETFSYYYHSRQPKRSREVILASKTNGIENESVTKLLGGMYQNVNVYENFIPVFDKLFVSPLSSQGDHYYDYSTPDTVMVNGRRFYHWVFVPKRKGETAFEGDAWVHDSSFAIQRIQLKLSGKSPLNHIENLSIYQDFQKVGDSVWFLSKDKFIADVYSVGKSNTGIKGRKTTTYRNIIFDADSVDKELMRNRIPEEVVVMPDSEKYSDTAWGKLRHEALSKTEAGIYHMIDTIQSLPVFKKYSNAIYTLTTGYKPLGKLEIGPWYNWVSANLWEGLRLRFDVGTTPKFMPNVYLHGYLAYGFLDQAFKGKAEAYYFLKRSPRSFIHVNLTEDLDNGQNYLDEISTDNIFTLAIRKPDVPVKFMKIRLQELEYYTSSRSGLSARFTVQHKQFEPLMNLPLKGNYPVARGEALNNFEAGVTLRFAYLERFIEGNFFRTSLGSDYPVVELRYQKGFSGVLNSNYDYHKLSLRVNDYLNIAPWGNLQVAAYAGKAFGTLPYMLLNVPPGNEIYYFNKYAFNLMNRFEFINDRYAGFAVEHNLGSGIFRWTGITRNLRWRQFWNVKTLWADLSEANRELNFVAGHPFTNLGGRAYIEAGTGIDNILKIFRLDLVWRLAPQPLPVQRVSRFGVFGSFRFGF